MAEDYWRTKMTILRAFVEEMKSLTAVDGEQGQFAAYHTIAGLIDTAKAAESKEHDASAEAMHKLIEGHFGESMAEGYAKLTHAAKALVCKAWEKEGDPGAWRVLHREINLSLVQTSE